MKYYKIVVPLTSRLLGVIPAENAEAALEKAKRLYGYKERAMRAFFVVEG